METAFETLLVSMEDHVAIILLNSAPVNAITPKMVAELEQAFETLGKETDLRAVIIGSAFPKVFAAGADINQFLHGGPEDNYRISTSGVSVFRKIEAFPHPVICAVNGGAFGGGLELAMFCDLRVADPKAKLGLTEAGLGIIPGYGGSQRLPRIVGPSMAKKMLFAGEVISGEEAYRIGLADILSPQGEALEAAKKYAAAVAEKAPIAVAADKRCVDFAMTHSLEEGYAFEVKTGSDIFNTQDKTEGAAAFLEKRKPNFCNK